MKFFKHSNVVLTSTETSFLYLLKRRSYIDLNVVLISIKTLSFLSKRKQFCSEMAVKRLEFITVLTLLCQLHKTFAQCPWTHDSAASDLQSGCLCNVNSKTQSLSVQCQSIDFPLLTQALRTYAGSNTVIENLFVNDSFIGSLSDFVFKNLKIISLQISGAQMIEVSENAFRGLFTKLF